MFCSTCLPLVGEPRLSRRTVTQLVLDNFRNVAGSRVQRHFRSCSIKSNSILGPTTDKAMTGHGQSQPWLRQYVQSSASKGVCSLATDMPWCSIDPPSPTEWKRWKNRQVEKPPWVLITKSTSCMLSASVALFGSSINEMANCSGRMQVQKYE